MKSSINNFQVVLYTSRRREVTRRYQPRSLVRHSFFHPKVFSAVIVALSLLLAVQPVMGNSGVSPWFVNCSASSCLNETGWVGVQCCQQATESTTPYWLVADYGSPSLTVSINWGDGSTTTFVVQEMGTMQCIYGTGSCYTYSFYGYHTYQATGTYSVTTTVTDTQANTAGALSTMTINCCPPAPTSSPDAVSGAGRVPVPM